MINDRIRFFKILILIVVGSLSIWAKGNYEINLDDCLYLAEYPQSIEDALRIYDDLIFQEKRYDVLYIKLSGDYFYVLESEDIGFVFLGDTRSEARLTEVRIYTKEYQDPNLKIISMKKSDLEEAIGNYDWNDQPEFTVIKSRDEEYLLFVKYEEGRVKQYEIGKNP